MPLVYGQDQRVADWVGAQCYGSAPPVTAAIGYESEGELKAGVYFDSQLPNTVFAHVASTVSVFPRDLIAAVAAYAFGQLGVERLTFLVSSSNERVLRFLTRLGAEVEGRMARAFGPADGVWLVLWNTAPASLRFMNWRATRRDMRHG